VNAVAPGNTATPMNEGVRTLPEYQPMLTSMSARTPSGRTFSTADEMAAMAVFLATSDARSMHGSTVLMDEGFSAGM
jgi:NAD(P)-dependent dehydrogenase (short-subunit alcohol dehydrogenase family)